MIHLNGTKFHIYVAFIKFKVDTDILLPGVVAETHSIHTATATYRTVVLSRTSVWNLPIRVKGCFCKSAYAVTHQCWGCLESNFRTISSISILPQVRWQITPNNKMTRTDIYYFSLFFLCFYSLLYTSAKTANISHHCQVFCCCLQSWKV